MNIKFENMIAQAALEEFPLELNCEVSVSKNPILEPTMMIYITLFSDKNRKRIVDGIFPYLPKSAYDRFVILYGSLVKEILEKSAFDVEDEIEEYYDDTNEELKKDIEEHILLGAQNVLENELLPELENIFRILGIFHNRIQTVKNIKRDIRTIKRFGSDIYSADTSYGTSFYIQNPKTVLNDQED